MDDIEKNQLKQFFKKLDHQKDTFDLTSDEDWTIWGIKFKECLSPSAAQNNIALKFLRAREGNVENGMNMFINTLKWRKTNNINTILTEEFPSEYKSLGQIYKKDKSGYPVTYNFYGHLQATDLIKTQQDADTFLRWRIQLMEKAIQQLDLSEDFAHVTQIHDYAGANFFPDKEMKKISKTIIQSFQDHYPEFLSQKLFINVPLILYTLFFIMSAFVSTKTKSKFRMISESDTNAALLEIIDMTSLPQRYGGIEGIPDKDFVKVVTIPPRSKISIPLPQAKSKFKPDQTLTVAWLVASNDIEIKFATLPGSPNIFEQVTDRRCHGKHTFVAPYLDDYQLIFNNDYSLLTSKTVYYYIFI